MGGGAVAPVWAARANGGWSGIWVKMCLQDQNFKKSPRIRYSLTKAFLVRFFARRTILNSFLGSVGRFGRVGGGSPRGQSMNPGLHEYYCFQVENLDFFKSSQNHPKSVWEHPRTVLCLFLAFLVHRRVQFAQK